MPLSTKFILSAEPDLTFPPLEVAASGGVAPYSYSIASGALPTGLVLDVATGRISGIPSSRGVYADIVVRATDATSTTVDASLLTIKVGVVAIGVVSDPVISGGATEGSVLVANPGVYTGDPQVTGQWCMDGVAVPGATGLLYTRQYSDVGKAPTYVETATNWTESVTATSNALAPTVNGLIARIGLRSAAGAAADLSRWTYCISADQTNFVTRAPAGSPAGFAGYVFKTGNGSFTTQSGVSGYSSFLHGQMSASGAGAFLGVQVPVGIPIKMRAAFGSLTQTGASGFRVSDGDLGPLFAGLPEVSGVTVSAGQIMQLDGTTIAAVDWQSQGAWFTVTSTTGYVYFRKAVAGGIMALRALEIAHPSFGAVTSGVGPFHVDNVDGNDITGDGSLARPWKNIPGEPSAGPDVAAFDVLVGGEVRLKRTSTPYRLPSPWENGGAVGVLSEATVAGSTSINCSNLNSSYNGRWVYLCDAAGAITEVIKIAASNSAGAATLATKLQVAHPVGSKVKAYRENFFRFTRSGEAANPITFTSYGAGASRPVIDGSEVLTSWDAAVAGDVSNNPNVSNILKSSLAAPAYLFNQMIHEGDRCLYPAQFPCPGDPGSYNKPYSGNDAFVDLSEVEYAAQMSEGGNNSGGTGYRLCTFTSPVLAAHYGPGDVSLVGYPFLGRAVGARIGEWEILTHNTSAGQITFKVENSNEGSSLGGSSETGGGHFIWCIRFHPFDIRKAGQYAYNRARTVVFGYFRGSEARAITRSEYCATFGNDHIIIDDIDIRGFGIDQGGGFRDAGLRVGCKIKNSVWSAISNNSGNGVFRPANDPGGSFELINVSAFDTGLIGMAQMSVRDSTIDGLMQRDAGRTSVYLGGSSSYNTVRNACVSDNGSIHGNGYSIYQAANHNVVEQAYAMNHPLGLTMQRSDIVVPDKSNTVRNVVLTGRRAYPGSTNPVVGTPTPATGGGYTGQILTGETNTLFDGVVSGAAPILYGASTPGGDPSTGMVIRNSIFSSIASVDLTGMTFENVLIIRENGVGISNLSGADPASFGYAFGDGAQYWDGTITEQMQTFLTRVGNSTDYALRSLGPNFNPWVVPAWGDGFELVDCAITTTRVRAGFRALDAFASVVNTRPGSSLSLPTAGDNALFGMYRGTIHWLAPPTAGTYELVVRQDNSHPNLIGGGSQIHDTTIMVRVV